MKNSLIKKLFILFFLSQSIACALGKIDDPYSLIKADPRRAGGVFMLYNFDTPPNAPAPKGYKPFYISHYGRHGARTSSNNAMFDNMLTMMTEYHNLGKLTKRGEQFYEMYVKLYPEVRLRGGDLTSRGQKEHQKLAQRMVHNYPEVFKKGIHADANSTNAPRAMMSMYAFLDGLRQCVPNITLSSCASSAVAVPLNPFVILNPDCKSTDVGFINSDAAWLPQLFAFTEKYRTPDVVINRLFSDSLGISKYGSHDYIEQMFYEVCETVQCMEGKELQWDIFSDEELGRIWEWDNLKYYLSKGPAPHSKGRQWAFVWRTMQDILDKADIALTSNKPIVDLRFGHDITIMSLMTLLDIEGWNDDVEDTQVKYYWQEFRVPMASNTQLVFYKNKRNEVIVRFMLNEVDQILPIKSPIAPYYKWEDFKEYAEKRIQFAREIIKKTKAPAKGKNSINYKSKLG